VEVEVNVGKRWRQPLVILGVVLVLIVVGALGAAYTVEDEGRPLLLTWSRYELYRYQNRLPGWCEDLAGAEELTVEVFDRDDPSVLVYSPALRGAWAKLDDLEREVQEAPAEALVLRDDVLAASGQVRETLTAAGVYVNRPTAETRLSLREALDAAREAREDLCPTQ
jgi:hypothetical protein